MTKCLECEGFSGKWDSDEGKCPSCSGLIDRLRFFRCKCGAEIQGGDQTDEHLIICPKCKRQGQVEVLSF